VGKRSDFAESFSVAQFILQFGLISAVFWLWQSHWIQPVKLMVVLFHEMSHGLMALLSGGRIINVVITADEGGWCETDGGNTLLIVSAGYLGSMLTGGLLLYLSRFRARVAGVYVLLTVTLAAAIFTVLHDPYSRKFATGLASAFIVVGCLTPALLGALLLRLLGTVSCLYSLFDIYSDILATGKSVAVGENDAVAISHITGMSPHAIGLVWLGISAAYFLLVLKISLTAQPAAPGKRAEAVAST